MILFPAVTGTSGIKWIVRPNPLLAMLKQNVRQNIKTEKENHLGKESRKQLSLEHPLIFNCPKVLYYNGFDVTKSGNFLYLSYQFLSK